MAAIVQHTPKARTATSGGTPNTVAFTYAGAVAASDLLFIILAIGATSGATGVADSLGQTWSKAISKTQSSITCEIWYKENTSAGTPTVTITVSGTSATNVTAELGEASGILASSSIDQTATASGALSSALQTGTTAATYESNELWLMGCAISNENGSVTGGPVSAITLDNQASGLASLLAAYQSVSSGGSGASTQWTNSVTVNWAAVVATFKVAVLAGMSVRHRRALRPSRPSPRRRTHEEPSPLGAMLLFTPVRRPPSQHPAKMVLRAAKRRRSSVVRKISAGAVLLFAGIKRPKARRMRAQDVMARRPRVSPARQHASMGAMLLAAIRRPPVPRPHARLRDGVRWFRRVIGAVVSAPAPVNVPPVKLYAEMTSVAVMDETPVIAVAQFYSEVHPVAVFHVEIK